MKNIYEDTQIDLVLTGLKANNRKQVMQELAMAIGPHINYSARTIYQILMDKEEHAQSGIGDGVAIPNLQLKELQTPFTALILLDKAIQFGSKDERPVDIICLLLTPEKDGTVHLRRLSRMSRLMKDPDLCKKIKESKDKDMIRSLFKSPEGWMLAA